MSTSEPSLAIRIQPKRHAAVRSPSLDAPVSGGDVGAREARLAIMVGGEKQAFERALPLFQKMGETIALMGGPGAGQHTKMANQIAIAGTMIGTIESLLYAKTAGLGMDAVIDIIGKGAAASWSLNNLGRRIAKGDFAPGFYIKHFVKDMGIALQEARRMKLSLPGLALVNQFYVAAQAQGLENLGTQGLFKVLCGDERISGLKDLVGQLHRSRARPVSIPGPGSGDEECESAARPGIPLGVLRAPGGQKLVRAVCRRNRKDAPAETGTETRCPCRAEPAGRSSGGSRSRERCSRGTSSTRGGTAETSVPNAGRSSCPKRGDGARDVRPVLEDELAHAVGKGRCRGRRSTKLPDLPGAWSQRRPPGFGS